MKHSPDGGFRLRQVFNHGAQQNLLSYAQNQYLDALGVFLDCGRQPASHAVTEIQFTLSQALASAFVIPAGFQVTNGDVTFETISQTTIAAGSLQATAQAQCLEAGTVGNGYLAGQISTIVSPLAFLATAVNTSESSGGSDEEDDESYAERLRHTYSIRSRFLRQLLMSRLILQPQASSTFIHCSLAGSCLKRHF